MSSIDNAVKVHRLSISAEDDDSKWEPKDCMICGGEETLEYDPDNLHSNTELNLEIPAAGHVCTDCENVFYESSVYKNILETEEKARGNHYVKFAINSGQISKYSLH